MKESDVRKRKKRKVRVVDSNTVSRALAFPNRDKMIKSPPVFKAVKEVVL